MDLFQSWFTVRIMYGVKHVGDEIVKAHDFRHACRLAQYIARTVARDSIPPWMFDERRVRWDVLEPV